MTRITRQLAAGLLSALLATSAVADDAIAPGVTDAIVAGPASATAASTVLGGTTGSAPPLLPTRNGREIYAAFRDGLADPDCSRDTSPGMQQHFANASRQLASRDSDALALFGYVVDALRAEDLPTEYALIPFVESGFRPGARSKSGPAGLWQFIAMTARNHDVPMRQGYDGRLSPVDSTRAAVRYLKTLHGMFAGDWRLAVMAFNAGEYRVFGALKRSGQRADTAQPLQLVGIPAITRSYVLKLHALSCVLDRADDREEWMRALDRPVARLMPTAVPAGVSTLDVLAKRNGLDAARLRRLNPALTNGEITGSAAGLMVMAPMTSASAARFVAMSDADADTSMPALPAMPSPPPTAGIAARAAGPTRIALAGQAAQPHADHVIPTLAGGISPGPPAKPAPTAPRSHTVVRGDSAWTIARRYGVRHADLLSRNGLTAKSVLRPGAVLAVDVGPL